MNAKRKFKKILSIMVATIIAVSQIVVFADGSTASNTISVTSDGTYPVKITYKFTDVSSTASAEFICNDDYSTVYKLKYPDRSGVETSYVFDMVLKSGQNTIKCDTSGAELVKAEIFTENARRYEGEELSNVGSESWNVFEIGNARFARIASDIVSESDRPSGYTKNIGEMITYNARSAGTYTFSICYTAQGWSKPVVYVNGEVCKDSFDIADNMSSNPLTGTIEVKLNEGNNQIFIGTTGENPQIYIDYIEITRPDYFTLYAKDAGTYPVEVSYTAQEGSKGTINVSNGAATIKYPVRDGKTHSYVVDLQLKAGKNNITVSGEDVKVDNISIFTGKTRRYEGEEISTYSVDDTWAFPIDSTSGARYGRVGTVNGPDDYKYGSWISYNAPAEGKYALKISCNGYYWKEPVIYVNNNKFSTGLYLNYESSSTPQEKTLIVELEKGENKIFVAAGDDKNSNQILVDYIDITETGNTGLGRTYLTAYKTTVNDKNEKERSNERIFSISAAEQYAKDSAEETDKNAVGDKLEVYNLTDKEKTVMCFIAVYEGGRLVNLSCKEVTVAEQSIADVEQETKYTENTDEVKIYAFDKETLAPISLACGIK